MAASRNPLRRIRLVYRRASPVLKGIVLVTIILCTVALLTLRLAILNTDRALEKARQEAVAQERENRELRRFISEMGTVQSVKDLAGRLLGLVDPDTVIFLPEE